MSKLFTIFLAFSGLLIACAPTPHRGPDKTFESELSRAALAAGAGAVTGFHLGVGAGPGAAVGAGLGAVAGAFHGFFRDRMEDRMALLMRETEHERRRAIAQEILSEQMKRRVEIHPTREIYPADIFFVGDSIKLRPEGKYVVAEMARLYKERLPWSRLVIAVYTKTLDEQSGYARFLAEGRCKEIILYLVKNGIEPHRLESRPMTIPAAVLVDPLDYPDRYNAAIEIIPVDR
ncbi:MAG TPA: hypothetical protein PKD37_06175 [Oligoflexia bacterium]|nr:hypothetical protein [Oligoflexia bacterium]HMP27548.1 hypothetical protein [Oligoflexia bacterium]